MIRSYLAQRVGFDPPSALFERMLLTCGQEWTPAPFVGKLGKQGMCFQNAGELCLSSGGRLRYVEGLAMSVIPVHHAWCVDREDRVVDPTWRSPKVEVEREYFGVAFEHGDVRDEILRTGYWGLFENNGCGGYNLDLFNRLAPGIVPAIFLKRAKERKPCLTE